MQRLHQKAVRGTSYHSVTDRFQIHDAMQIRCRTQLVANVANLRYADAGRRLRATMPGKRRIGNEAQVAEFFAGKQIGVGADERAQHRFGDDFRGQRAVEEKIQVRA